ncbi:MAG: ATP-binding domain-containing protein, partial [Pseudomonadota bacterium]
STYLNSTLFDTSTSDEITLCLNYDGLYGINNINRFLQSSNPNPPIVWRDSTYKVGDPILFSDTARFRPIIYNNLKGRIVSINKVAGSIQFDVMLDRSITALDLIGTELTWVTDSTVRFSVYDFVTSSDDDDDSLNTIVPFQVAYAVSIHKAQGLEYDSVKIVITDSNEDDISHSIFYTAITRTRNQLKVFWTPETQQKVLSKLNRNFNGKDLSIIRGRRNLSPV